MKWTVWIREGDNVPWRLKTTFDDLDRARHCADATVYQSVGDLEAIVRDEAGNTVYEGED
jgi:hypothetical protein